MKEDTFSTFGQKEALKLFREAKPHPPSNGVVLLGAVWPRLSAVRDQVRARTTADSTSLVNQMKGEGRPKGKRGEVCVEAAERFTSALLTAGTLRTSHLEDEEEEDGSPLMCP